MKPGLLQPQPLARRPGCLLMFSKVLVANRGEIAVRINQTLRAMGISSVAVYSDPDAGAPHVQTAEESAALPGRTAEETYLSIPKIVQAARNSGADAIHPGYGFLSENPAFARACAGSGDHLHRTIPGKHGGPGRQTALQGDSPGRRGPVVPSSPECLPGDAAAREFVVRWGFPLLVKAAAGGVAGVCAWSTSWASWTGRWSRPAASLKPPSATAVFLERFIPNPRTWRSRCGPTSRGILFTWASGNAASSAVTRK